MGSQIIGPHKKLRVAVEKLIVIFDLGASEIGCKKMDKILQQSLTMVNAPLAFVCCDAKWNIQQRSHRWLELFPHSTLMENLSCISTMDAQYASGDWSVLQSIFETGESQMLAVQVSPPGSDHFEGTLVVWYEATAGSEFLRLVLLDADCQGVNGELDRLRMQYELILSAAGEGIYGLDLQGRTTFANQATVDLLGWEPGEILGAPLHDIHHHSHPDGSPYPRETCPIYAAFNDGAVHRVDDEVFWRADGSSVPVEYISTPIIHEGSLQGAVVTFRDISERKKAEAELEKQYAEIKRLKDELEQERDYLRDEIQTSANFGSIIGSSPALKRTLAQIEAVAATPTSVLVLGESGVGKEMIARAIHAQSPRASESLVKVNCASIPKELFESEFFGHVKGAFTGAHRDRVGRMQLANGGTLFLDEVGEIPLDLQGKLLRALQEREFERVGDERTITVDVRIVAATNKNLEEEVKAGRFREDLYYRLSVFPISVPPLRERSQDIPLLAQYFLDEQCQQFGREPMLLTKAQAHSVSHMSWPGNIRELKNVIERAIILSRGRRLRLDLALPDLAPSDLVVQAPPAQHEEVLTEDEFRQLEKSNLLKALEQCAWKISGDNGAAALLGIKASTLSYRMNNFGITRP